MFGNVNGMTDPSEPSATALSFQCVSKGFGDTPVLDAVTFNVDRGQLFGLVGGNGAGKTTLIKCLLDFCRPTAGEIQIFGDSNRSTHSRTGVAFLPERFSPPYYVTGRDFLRYMSELHRKPYDEELAKRTFEDLDLDASALTRSARTYSKGMTQKLGLAACVLSGKPLQILDEPTSGLDPKARALLKRRLRSLRKAGATVFFTTHTLADVDEICDRMAVLHRGRLRFVGTPVALRTSYGGDLEHAYLACVDEAIAA
jgi:ABC-2 type transport system ATP-binding protein